MNSRITKTQRALLDRVCERLQHNNDPLAVGSAFEPLDKSITDAQSRTLLYEFKRLMLRAAKEPAIRPDALALLGSWGDTLSDEEIFEYVVTHQGEIWLETFAPASR
jgi:hypothetical protein